jgi:HlyD family secretion protein
MNLTNSIATVEAPAAGLTRMTPHLGASADTSKRKRRKRYWGAGVILALLVLAGIALLGRSRGKATPKYITSPVTRGGIAQTVEATGTINAVTTVQVGSQVSGFISKLNADFNSRVHKGDLIAEIDPRVYEGQLLQARADLENAKANLATAQANVANSQAKSIQAAADYRRTAPLGESGVMSAQQVDAAKATADSAEAQVVANEATVKQAAAQVAQRQAALEIAETNLAYTKIYAPIDGIVINRAVDLGQTVAASFQTPTLFTIAQDLTKMQLHVSTDEGDVGNIHVGRPARFRVDAFPGETFTGVISQVRMNATTVQNVVTYETIVDFDNPNGKLFPGMTAYVSIPVASVTDALKVPNTAIRYKPNKTQAEMRDLLASNGIQLPEGFSGSEDLSASTSASGQQDRARSLSLVWKLLPDRSLKPVLIRRGITDHSFTAVEVVQGTLAVGNAVVTDEQTSSSGGFGPPR